MVAESLAPYSIPALTSGTHCVYRMFIGEELVYVGMTNNPTRRFRQHRRHKWWWRDVTWMDRYWTSSKANALRIEAEMIQRENPRFNVIHPEVKW